MKSFRIPIIISILIHALIFLSITWINLDSEYNVSEKVFVVLMEEKQDKPQRRTIPKRKTPSLNIDIKQNIIATSVNLNIANRPSYLIYDANTSPAFYDNIGNINYKTNYVIENKNISYQNMLKPISTLIRKTDARPASPKIDKVEGSKFVINNLPILKNSKVSFAQNNNTEAMRKFLDVVRKKIESNKRYPIFAMNAGIEGRCGVIINILSSGQLENTEIADSSGNVLLDKAALESVRNSAPFPPIPSEMEFDRTTIRISLVFRLSH